MEGKARRGISVLVIAFVLVVGTVVPGMMVFGDAEQDGTGLFETIEDVETVVLIDTDSPEMVEDLSLEGEILDHYGRNVLMRTDERTARELESELDAQILENRNEISVKGHTFDTNEGFPELNSELKIEGYDSETEGLYIVDMMGPINPEWREQIEDIGVNVFNYQPNYAYEVIMTPEQAEEVEDFDFVDWVGIYQPEFKMHSEIDEALDKEMPLNIRLRPGFDASTLNMIEAEADVLGVEDLREDGSRVTVDIESMDDVEDLALENDVYYIAPYVEPELHAEMDIQLIGGGQWFMDDEYDRRDDLTPPPREGDPQEPYRKHGDYGAYINQLGYSGEGVTVAVADSGIGDGSVGDAGVEDFTGRVVDGYGFEQEDDWADGMGHGTQCTGLVSGDTYRGTGETWDETEDGDMEYYMGQGLGYESELFGTKIFDDGGGFIPAEYYPIVEEPAQRSDAYIHTNSWGAGTMGEYSDSDEIFDQAVRDADRDTDENVPMVITTSAGNDGGRGDYDQEIGSPANAKNTIAIGGNEPYNPGLNRENPENMYGMSSRGWTEDNRIQPDVIAPSEDVISQNTPLEGGGYVASSGTSFGNPLVAGAATIIVEWYEERYDEKPSPAMVRSILVNTAEELDPEVGNTGGNIPSDGHVPNRDEGWGVPNLSKLEYPKEEPMGFQLEDQETLIETGEVEEYEFNPADEDEPLKVTLSYTDKNAQEGDSAGGTPTLKNNLDLEVESPGGDIYRGNAFDETGDGTSDSGYSYPNTDVMDDFDYDGDGWDDVNNVQNVFIHPDELESGSYTVRVHGTNVPEDANNDGEANQDYALSASNVPDDIVDIEVPDKEGEIEIEKDEYAGEDLVNVTLNDIILEGEGTHEVNVTSYDEDGEEIEVKTLELEEDEENLGFFEGQVQLSEEDEEGTLQVDHAGEIEAEYWDADPGHPDDLEEGMDSENEDLLTETPHEEIPKIAVIDEIDYFEGEIAYQLEQRLVGPYVVDTLEADELIDEMENYDAFVPWRFGSDSLAEDFLDELEDDQAAIYLDSDEGATDEGYPDGVTRLHNVRDDPEEHWAEGLDTRPPVQIDIQEDHEIFDGVGEEDDVVDMYVGSNIYGSYYEDYSGDDLAEVIYHNDDTTYEGQGVGIDEDGNEILLPAVGIDYFAPPDDPDWTDEAWTLLANSVEYFTEMPDDVVGVSEILEPPERVNTEEDHAIETLVENLGDADHEDVPVETTINEFVTALHEDFDDEIPDDWEIDDTSDETWHHGTSSADIDVTRDEIQEEWLISPEIDVSDGSHTTLIFDHDLSPSFGDPEYTAEVQVSSDGGDEWDLIEEWDGDDDPDGEYEYDISDYADGEEEVHVAFVWHSSDDDDHSTFCDWSIEEVTVEYVQDVYQDEIEVDVDAGEETTAVFEDWNPDEKGEYLMESTTEDLDDEIVGFGTTQDIIVEDVHGVEVSEIISPSDTVMIDEVHDVTTAIENYGTFDEEEVPVDVEMEQVLYWLDEDFHDEIPDEWEIDDTSDETWEHYFDDEGMARVEDDDGEVQEEWLISPEIDASEAEGTELVVDHDFDDGIEGDPYGEISITTDGGDTWEEIDNFTDDDFGEIYYDISEYADGEENVQIGFLYETDDHGGDPFTPDSWEIYEVMVTSLDDEYDDATTIDIDAQETKEVEFEEWDPEEVGEYEINVSTELDDELDYVRETILVRAPEANLGVDEIISPETEVWEETQDVEAEITNYGDFMVEDVPVEAKAEHVEGFVEDFSGSFPPEGWETDDWTQSDSNEAGGNPPEANLYWFDVGDDDYSYLQSPAVDTTEADELTLEFFSYIDHSTDQFDAIVQARSDPDESWQDVTPWENPVDGSIAPDHYEVNLTDHIGPETQVIFEYHGSTIELDDWFVNDVILGEREEDYSDEIEVTIDEDETINAEFEDWTPSDAGEYVFNITAKHEDETDPDSATLEQFTEVIPIVYDLEATSIDEPEEPIFDFQERNVTGTVTNVGNQDIDEGPVEMSIEQIIDDIPLDEDFSDDPFDNGWEAEDRDGNDNTWEYNEEEEKVEITPIDDHEHDILWSEMADCSDGEHRVILEFFSEFEGNYDENERSLLISTDEGDSYKRIGRNITHGEQEYDITQWASEEDEVWIGWEIYSEEVEEDEYWGIDDVTITTEYTEEEYYDEQEVENLSVGQDEQVQFDDWTPETEEPSDYILTMVTDHPEDDNLENVEVSERVFVDEHEDPEVSDPSPYDGEEDVTHSPLMNVTVNDPNDYHMDVTFYLYDEDGYEIGNETVEEVMSGEEAATQFVLLETNSTFEWHVEVYDGVTTIESDTWEFHTYEPEGRYVHDTADINADPPEQVENLELDWDADPWAVTGNELTWDASPDDGAGYDDTEYYEVYRAEDQDGPWDEPIAEVEADGSEEYSYVDEGMADDGEQWHYVVRAVDRVGNREMNEDSVYELPLPEATEPEPEHDEWVTGLEQDLSVDVTNPTDQYIEVEFYDGNWDQLIDSFEIIEDQRLETTWELEEERMANDNHWYVMVTYEDYNMGSINPGMYTLDVDVAGQGTVEIDPEEDNYIEGTDVDLEAIPEDAEWQFTEWTGDYEGTEEEITVTMDSDKEITANFEHVGELEGEWRWLYEADHRFEADNAGGVGPDPIDWYGAMRLDLSDDIGGYISEVAYYDYDDDTGEFGDWAYGYIAEDDGGAPGEWLTETEEYNPEGAGWVELELDEDVMIEEDEYWIVMHIDDPGDGHFPFGIDDTSYPDEGQWITWEDPHDPANWEESGLGAWGLEAYVEVPVTGDEIDEEPTDEELMGDEVDVAVVDADNWQEYEIEYKLEDYLPDDEYNVETLWNEDNEHWDDWLIDEIDNYDTFVIQRYEYTEADSEAAAEDFLDNLQDGQGVVYLDTHVGASQEGYSDGVTQLHNVRDDPGYHDSEGTGTNPPQYLEILEDHPIFEDIGEEGDEVLMFDGTTNWGSWFDEYSGEILAEKDYGGGYGGPAVGVCEDRNEVLLPAKGIGFFGEADDPGWSEEANQMFANAVEYTSDPAAVPEGYGWSFHLEDDVEPHAEFHIEEEPDYYQGDTITLNATESYNPPSDNAGIENYTWEIVDPYDETYYFYEPVIEKPLEYALYYDITLTVTDAYGNSAEAWDEIYAIDTEDPVADAGTSDQTRVGVEYELDGSGSTDNVGVEDWSWSIEGISGEAEGYYDTTEGEIVDYVFPYQGTYDVYLEVSDEEGNTDTDKISVIVNPPVEAFDITSPEEDYVIIEQDTVTVEWEGHEYLGDIDYEIRINYGDWDDIGTDTDYTFIGLEDGTHVVQVRATDGAGNRYTETRVFEVSTIEEKLEIFSPEDGVESLTYDEEFTIHGETDPNLDVYVNDASVSVDDNGEFVYETDLIEGQNVFTVQAMDDEEIVAEATVYALYLPELEELNDELDDLRDDLNDVETGLQTQIDDLFDELDDIETELQNQIDDLDDELDDVESDLQAQIDDIEGDINHIEGNIDDIEGNIDDIEGNIDDIEGDIDGIEGNIEDIEAEIEDIEGDIEDIEAEIEDIEGNIADIEDDISDLEDDVDMARNLGIVGMVLAILAVIIAVFAVMMKKGGNEPVKEETRETESFEE